MREVTNRKAEGLGPGLRSWVAKPHPSFIKRDTILEDSPQLEVFSFHGPPTAHILCAPSDAENTLVLLISKAEIYQFSTVP